MGGYGPDVEFIDRALDWAFNRLTLDTRRLAITGFSDGASYALSLGITNGDLFMRVIAFSPGFMAPATRRGKPQVFVSHGTRDRVLPIKRCSRRIVPQLDHAGYRVGTGSSKAATWCRPRSDTEPCAGSSHREAEILPETGETDDNSSRRRGL
jgi:predicted esterase